jgi:RIO kinase 2
MKLDATDLRYVTSEEFRVLTAVSLLIYYFQFTIHWPQVEMGSKNHEVVPVVLIAQISGLRNGGVNKLIGSLAKRNLVSKVQNAKCQRLHLYPITY